MSEAGDNLKSFILERMKMTHIYQPIMLKVLLNRGGKATVSEIAKAIASHDPSQVEYYEQVVKKMPGDVLFKHGVVEKLKRGKKVEGFGFQSFDDFSVDEIKGLVKICEEKLDNFLVARKADIWQHRRKNRKAVSGTIRYEVFKRAKQRCELCGIHDHKKALEVDHITPKNKGGKDDICNYQALCYSCNASKGDRDDTDFRDIEKAFQHRVDDCLFCNINHNRKVIAENELAYAIKDGFPVTDGHVLIIPKRHAAEYFDLYQPEINATTQLINQLKDMIKNNDPTVEGFNIGMNCGEVAGQTVMHCHIHLIPRREGDVQNPKGGVRGIIADKADYTQLSQDKP